MATAASCREIGEPPEAGFTRSGIGSKPGGRRSGGKMAGATIITAGAWHALDDDDRRAFMGSA